MSLPLSRPSLRRQDFDQVLDAMVHDRLTGGDTNRLLSKEIARGLDLKDCSVLASVSDGVRRILTGLGLVSGDSVALSPLAPPYWSAVMAELGIVPEYCDVDPRSPVLADSLVDQMKSRCRAVVADCCLGYIPNLPALARSGLLVIEDISQWLGGRWGQPVGTFGHGVLISFSPETLVAGAGGCAVGFRAVSSAQPEREWESLSDLGASLILSQWKDRAEFSEKKTDHFRRLFLKLKGHRPPVQLGEGEAVFPWFALVVDQGAKEVLAHARRHAVEADWAFRNLPHFHSDSERDFCPNARSFLFKTLVFPLYANISERDLTDLGKVLSSLP